MTQDAKDFAKQVKEEILKIVKEKAKKRNGCFAGSVTMDLDKEKMLTALEIWNVKFRYKDSTAYVNAKGDYKLNRSIKNMRLGKLRETS